MSEAAILALRHDWGNRSVLTIHNLSDKSHRVSFSLGQVAPHGLVDLFGHGGFTIEKMEPSPSRSGVTPTDGFAFGAPPKISRFRVGCARFRSHVRKML